MLRLKLKIIIIVLYLEISITVPKVTFLAIVFIKCNPEYKNLMFLFCEFEYKVYNINVLFAEVSIHYLKNHLNIEIQD